jgi:hypothetical protein
MNLRLTATLAVALCWFGGARLAHADPLDPALERFVTNPECRTASGAYIPQSDGKGGFVACLPDQAKFTKLVNQLGFALAPTAMHSARTTGVGGFELAIEANYATISGNREYWKSGTEGAVNPNTGAFSTRNSSPPSLLQNYALKFRKGFGFGLELTGVVGFVPQSSIISGGADVRMSLFEGFRSGIPGYIPDVAVGGGVRTISGTSALQLTVMGFDGQISKPIAIADSSQLTPWVGYQYLFIYGDSGIIDLTPATDAVQACNYSGSAVPGNPDPNKTTSTGEHAYDGSPVCRGGQGADFNNNAVFDAVRLRRHRMLFGLNYRYEMVMIGGQFIMDLVPPSSAQPDANNSKVLSGEAKQYSFVFELGAMF